MSAPISIIISGASAFIITWILSYIMIPLLRKKKAEQHVRDDGPQTHLVKEGTPTMGGIMIVIGMCAAVLIASVWNDSLSIAIAAFVIISTIAFMLIGFIDDSIKLFKKRSLGLRAWQKIVFEFIASIGVACYSYFILNNNSELIPFAQNYIDMGVWYIPFTMFVFIAMVNSVNLTDGLDGLAASLTLIDACAYLVIFLVSAFGYSLLNNSETYNQNVGVFAVAIIGACAAFLCFDRHPAKVFMGDTGSFALGAAITALSTIMGMQLLLPIMGLMFVLSAVSVIIQVGSYKLRGKRVFRMAPLHHHFELGGASETQVLRGYIIATVILAAVSILSVCTVR